MHFRTNSRFGTKLNYSQHFCHLGNRKSWFNIQIVLLVISKSPISSSDHPQFFIQHLHFVYKNSRRFKSRYIFTTFILAILPLARVEITEEKETRFELLYLRTDLLPKTKTKLQLLFAIKSQASRNPLLDPIMINIWVIWKSQKLEIVANLIMRYATMAENIKLDFSILTRQKRHWQ